MVCFPQASQWLAHSSALLDTQTGPIHQDSLITLPTGGLSGLWSSLRTSGQTVNRNPSQLLFTRSLSQTKATLPLPCMCELLTSTLLIIHHYSHNWTSEVAQEVKNLRASAANIRDTGLIPGSGRSLEEGIAVHPSILAWRIPWTQEPDGLQSIGSQRVGQTKVTYTPYPPYTHTH